MSQRGSFCSRIAAKRAKSDKILLEILSMIDKRLPLLKRSKLKIKKNPVMQDIFLTLFHLYSSGKKKNSGIQEIYSLFSTF